VHDAANILRRYFNQLPEPIIPLQYYDAFRQPLRGHQAEAVGQIEGQAPSVGGFDPEAAVRIYQRIIKELPSLNRQLLLYILDLLAVFAAKSDVNKMTTSNLAAIFQPGILSHPQHDMSPQDYRLSQDVLIFLIDNQDHFLIGMEGTAVDEGTVKHVESGPSTPQARTPTTPGRNNFAPGRSASTASSAGAESLRKYGVRRNVSTSSRQSRHSGAVPSPTTPQFASSSGVHRSNTVPSKRSPALAAVRFPRERGSDPPTPGVEETKTQLPATTPEVPTPTTSPLQEPPKHIDLPPQDPHLSTSRAQTFPVEKLDVVKPGAPPQTEVAKPGLSTPALDSIPGAFPLPSPGIIPPTPDTITPEAATQAAHALVPSSQTQPHSSPHGTPKHEKSEFMEGPIDPGPTADLPTAVRTFTQILSGNKVSLSGDEKQGGRKPNKLQKKRGPSANPSAHSSTHSLTGTHSGFDAPPSPLSQPSFPQAMISGSKEVLHSFPNSETGSSRNSGATLKPTMSPSASFRSHSTATEYSEAEPSEEIPKEEKRSFWKNHKRGESKATPTASQTDLHGSVPGGDKSMSSFGSGSGWAGGRRSLQYDSQPSSDLSVPFTETKEQGEKKGPFDWFQKKRQEHKERADKKNRAKSPPGSTYDLASSQSVLKLKDDGMGRGRSMDIPRNSSKTDTSDTTPTGISSISTSATAALQQPVPQAQQPAQSIAVHSQGSHQVQTLGQAQQPQQQAQQVTESAVEHGTSSGDTSNNPGSSSSAT